MVQWPAVVASGWEGWEEERVLPLQAGVGGLEDGLPGGAVIKATGSPALRGGGAEDARLSPDSCWCLPQAEPSQKPPQGAGCCWSQSRLPSTGWAERVGSGSGGTQDDQCC